MIITSSRIRARSGHKAIANHVLRGKDNEKVILLRGGEHRLKAAMEDARSFGRTYGLRHFTVNPSERLSREQVAEVLQELATEFQFDPAEATVIEHQKRRADGKGHDRHWHVLVSEVDAITGRCMSSSHTYARQEKVARVAEIRFGHPVTPGRHNKAVVEALRREGRLEIAQKLEAVGITQGQLPHSAFTSAQHQEMKRKGQHLPELKTIVATAWERSDGRKALEAALSEHGLTVRQGDKKDTWLIEQEGQFLGALHRLAGVRKAAVVARMKEEVPTHENRSPTHLQQQPGPARFEPADLYRSQRCPRDGEPDPQPSRSATGRERRARSNPSAHGPTNEDRAAGDSDREADRANRKEARDRRRRMIAAARLRSRIRQYPERLKPPPPPPKKRRIQAEGAFYHPLVGQQIRSDRQARGLAWRWQQLGFQTAFDAQPPRSVVIQGNGWSIRDFGNLVTLSTVDDRAIAVMVDKAKREWGGAIECSGSPQFLEASWLECQRQGVAFSVKGDPNWQPPEHIRMAWELEQQEAQYQREQLAPQDEVDYTYTTAEEPARFGL